MNNHTKKFLLSICALTACNIKTMQQDEATTNNPQQPQSMTTQTTTSTCAPCEEGQHVSSFFDLPNDIIDIITEYCKANPKANGHLRQLCKRFGTPQNRDNQLVNLLCLTSRDDSQDAIALKILPFLSMKDNARLRATCRLLRFVWNHESEITINHFNKFQEFLRLQKGVGARNPVTINLHLQYINNLPNGVNLLRNVKEIVLTPQKVQATAMQQLCTTFPNILHLGLLSSTSPLPKCISELSKLRSLDLSASDITTTDIAQICTSHTNLRSLCLTNNRLIELPSQMKRLNELQRLDLAGNKLLVETANNIALWCPHLEELNLRYCNLTAIPVTIYQLKQLKVLDLSANPLTYHAIEEFCKAQPSTCNGNTCQSCMLNELQTIKLYNINYDWEEKENIVKLFKMIAPNAHIKFNWNKSF